VRKKLVGLVAMGVLLGLTIGCGGGPKDRPQTAAATGTVKFKGQAVAGATVTFSPKGTGLRAAVGTTDSSGRFKLTTLTAGDGAMPGSYTVAIVKTEGTAAAPAVPSSDAAKSPEAMAAAWKEAKANWEKQPKGGTASKGDVLPVKYKTAASSGLTADVKAQGTNDFTFDLTE